MTRIAFTILRKLKIRKVMKLVIRGEHMKLHKKNRHSGKDDSCSEKKVAMLKSD